MDIVQLGEFCIVGWFIDTFILFPMNFKTQIIIPKGLKVTWTLYSIISGH